MRFKEFTSIALTLGLVACINGQTPQPNRPLNPGAVPYNAYRPPLYGMDDVSRSMNLSPQQITQLNQLTDQTQAAYRDRYTQLNSLPEAERASRLQALNQQYQGDWMRGARTIFNENQLSRYQQLNYQYGGFGSLADPEVQKRLNLTEAQRNALRQNLEWSSQQLGNLNRLGVDDREKAAQAYRTYQEQHQQRFTQFLTPEQMRTWREMTGEPYSFPPTFTPGR